MKFLHLADLHIGKTVNDFSMLEEQRHVFSQIIKYIQTERPDAVIIAGDVYDRAVPGVEAVRLFDDFLTDIAHENAAVLLISGNHDSPERLSFASRLLSDKKLFLYGTFDGTTQKVTLSDEAGQVNFWLLPFIKILDEHINETYASVLESADVDYSERNILVSHQFYTKAGVETIRSTSVNPVGGLDGTDAGLIERFDYAALGHLHAPQTVGAAHIRYSGSPVKYSFSEWRQVKSVTLVEIQKKGDLKITLLPLMPIHDMREIKGRLDTLISPEVYSLADREDYIRAVLTDEEEIIDPMGKLRSVYPNIMNAAFENSRTAAAMNLVTSEAEAVETLTPLELFGEFFKETQGASMSEEQAALVRDLFEDDTDVGQAAVFQHTVTDNAQGLQKEGAVE